MTTEELLETSAEIAPPTGRLSRATRRGQVVLSLGIAPAVFWLAFDHGSFGVAQWTSVAIVVWWTILGGLAFALWPRRPVPLTAWLVGGLLTAYAALSGISALWSTGAEAPFLEMDRTLLYVGVFVLTVLAAGRGHIDRWSDGIALGLVAVATLALASRLFPGHLVYEATAQFLPEARTRLSYPVGYWNGLAILVALACPLLLRAAVAARSATVRGLALAPMPIVATTIFLASSRTGAVAAAVGTGAFVVLAGRRWTAAGAAATAWVASIAAVVFAADQHELVNGPLDSAVAIEQGRNVGLAVVLLGLAAAVAHALLSHALRGTRVPTSLGWLASGALAAAIVAGSFAAHPLRLWQNFTRPPTADVQADYISSHFLSVSGNWRWQYWESAIDAFRTRPLLGRGAGSYEAWWAEHGTVTGFVGNAHSLYFETLGELGAVGLTLILGAFIVGTGAGVRRALSGDRALRDGAGAVVAAFLAFAVAAGADWMWKLPAVSIVGAALLSLAVSPTGAMADFRPRTHKRVRAQRIGLLALAMAVLASQTILWGAERKLRDSRNAVERGDHAAAVEAAESARTLEPWAASPYLQLALANELRGRLKPAREFMRQAIDRDRDDWRLWLIAARIETKLGNIAAARESLAQAKKLNPRSPVFLLLGSKTG